MPLLGRLKIYDLDENTTVEFFSMISTIHHIQSDIFYLLLLRFFAKVFS